jgi:hypothetical protein
MLDSEFASNVGEVPREVPRAVDSSEAIELRLPLVPVMVLNVVVKSVSISWRNV